MGRDPSRAGVLVAFHGLYATKRKHGTARRHHEISARTHCPGNISWRDELAR